MIIFPKGLLTLAEAAKKYGFKQDSLRDYVNRGRLEAAKRGKIWYTTDEAMKRYISSRDAERIPNKYRNKNKRP